MSGPKNDPFIRTPVFEDHRLGEVMEPLMTEEEVRRVQGRDGLGLGPYHEAREDRPDLNLTEEDYAAERIRMNAELGQCTTRAARRLWWFARDSGQTVKQFTKANWWVTLGFNNRALEMFWVLTKLNDPVVKTKRSFIESCKSDHIERYRGIGKVTIKEALKLIGYERRRNRCRLCGAYTTPHYHGLHGPIRRGTPGGKIPEVDRYIVTKTKGPKT